MSLGPHRRARTLVLSAALLCAAVVSPGCSAHLLSTPNPPPSDDRPVVRIETRGGVEFGAATDHGILFLARTAQDGPCRVHYFLGDQVFVEDGVIENVGGVIYRASIDLDHQQAHLLGRDVTADDRLIALSMDGASVRESSLRLSTSPGVGGDVLDWPGRRLPVGTPLFVREDGALLLAGLVAAEAKLADRDGDDRRFVVFAGADRLREMLLEPVPHPAPRRIKHRPDGISVIK